MCDFLWAILFVSKIDCIRFVVSGTLAFASLIRLCGTQTLEHLTIAVPPSYFIHQYNFLFSTRLVRIEF